MDEKKAGHRPPQLAPKEDHRQQFNNISLHRLQQHNIRLWGFLSRLLNQDVRGDLKRDNYEKRDRRHHENHDTWGDTVVALIPNAWIPTYAKQHAHHKQYHHFDCKNPRGCKA